MFKLPKKSNQTGAVPALLLITIIGIVLLLAISSHAPIKDFILGKLYPKPESRANTWTQIKSAGFEKSDFSEWDQYNQSEGTLKVLNGADTPAGTAEGTKIAEAVQNGSGNTNGHFSRSIWNLDNWAAGKIFRTEAKFFLPNDFYSNMMGAVQLIGWDTFPELNNQMRLIIYNSDKKARLFINDNNNKREITGTFNITEGIWNTLAIEQMISETDGWSKVYLNGQLAASGDKSNCPSNANNCADTQSAFPVTRIRYGIVAIDDPKQLKPLTLYFDDVTLSTGSISSSEPSPIPTPFPSPSAISTSATDLLVSPSPSSTDTIAPTVTINTPLNSTIINRNSSFTISATASDNIGVVKMEFFVDGSLKCTSSFSTYSCNTKIGGKPNASHVITVKAYDKVNNNSASQISIKTK